MPESYNKEQATGYRLRNRDYVRAAKARPCEMCGVSYHFSVMDFHHRDPDTKYSHISRLGQITASLKRIQSEIDKCVLLCANYHRLHTYEVQRGSL